MGAARDVRGYFAFLIASLVVIAAVFAGCTLYERTAFALYRLGMSGPPLFTPYYLGRLAAIAGLSLAMVAGLYRLSGGTAIDRQSLPSSRRAFVYAWLAVVAAGVVLFILDPALFHDIALEDGLVEWLSALLPLAASGGFVYASVRILRSAAPRRGVAVALSVLFAVVLFVIGMEEISWMQRIFNVETPELFSANEQQETNLHNMYSSLFFNVVYRTGVYGGLIVLPFLAETAPRNRLFDEIGDFLPGRFVLAASAPLLGFDYNFWNFFLGPLLLGLGVAILICYATVAAGRGNGEEALLFTTLAAFALTSQAIFLAFGTGFRHTWIISEYRELLLAAGLAAFAWDVVGRVRARFGVGREPYRAVAAPH